MLNLSPVGFCIYCGSTTNLTDEHIIPFALNGTSVLPKASCETCAVITGRFEQEVCRKQLWPARAKLGLQTRRPKERPASFPMTFKEGEKIWKENIPIDDHPAVFFMQLLDNAPIFQGLDFKPIVPRTNVWVGGAPQHIRRGVRSEVGVDFEFSPYHFFKTITKIAHAFAFAAARGKFEPWLGPWIIDCAEKLRRDHLGTNDLILPRSPNLHELDLYEWAPLGLSWVVVNVRLFANCAAPTYHVVVGRPI